MTPQDRFNIFLYVQAHQPCAATDISYALALSYREVRDHLNIHKPTRYGCKKSQATGLRVWYVNT